LSELIKIVDLHASIQGKEILKGVNLTISAGEVHAIMGKNGSGKSTLSNIIMGHPNYEITKGDILFRGESILGLKTDERAKKGIFLCFQYPTGIPGVTVANFLRTVLKSLTGKEIAIKDFRKDLKEAMKLLQMDDSFVSRYVNDGFSGGEKKRNEIFQMAMLEPKLSILDETDSGLDIDALRIVANGVNKLRTKNNAVIVVTHYQRLLDYIVPDFVHVLYKGKIVKSGGKELALELEAKGYDWIKNEVAVA